MYRLLKFTGMLLKNIPRKAGYFFFRLIAYAAFLTGGLRKKNLTDNLTRVMGRKPSARELLKNYNNYAMYYFDLFKDKNLLLESLDMESFEPLDSAIRSRLEKGLPSIIATMHYGNWDLGGALVSYKFPGKVTVVVEKLSDGAFKWFTETRKSWGMNIIKSTDIKGMLKVLKSGGILVLVSDRDLEKTGFNPLFFGRKAFIPSGPAKLSLMSGAPIFFGAIKRKPDNPFLYAVECGNTVINSGNIPRTAENEIKLTDELIKQFENILQQDPFQWCMLQQVWLE